MSILLDNNWRDGQRMNFGHTLRLGEMGQELFDSIYKIGAINLEFIIELNTNRYGEGYIVRFDRNKLGLPSSRIVMKDDYPYRGLGAL